MRYVFLLLFSPLVALSVGYPPQILCLMRFPGFCRVFELVEGPDVSLNRCSALS